MKKKNIIAIIIVCVLVLICGLIVYLLVSNKKLEKIRNTEFNNAVTKYYERHISNIKGVDEAEITLKMINDAVTKNFEKYEIASLKKCDESSTAIVYLKNGKIENIEILLTCK